MKLSRLLSKVQRLLIITGTLLFFVSISPAPFVFAEAASDCVAPSASTPGVHVPTGSDAAMYHYDCDQQLWISAHYSYNPQTNSTLPLDGTVYTYNATTAQWDYDIWVYVASKGDYALRTFSVSTPPLGATTIGGPVATPPAETAASGESTATATAQGTNGALAIADTTNGAATAIAVTNSIGSIATTGNAGVVANTQGGNATTGNALAMATLVNMLQSSGNVFGSAGNAVVFNTTISGDVTGDILLDPSLIGSIQPSSTSPYSSTDGSSLTQSNTNMSITNDLDLGASSGNALVEANTAAGTATSGSATAIANVLNFLNSTIVSGRSFLGVINIDGNLNGDILLPPSFIDELLASNVPALSVAVPLSTNGSLNTSVSQSINNAVTATADSGNALVDKNTTAGHATSGNGTTNITTFNLTGNTILGKNALLVFVNVLGTWYGLIFNAPSGATAASLGGDISLASTSVTSQNIGQYDTSQTINNNIVAIAKSGDATVTKNTTAGDARTGDTKVGVNILNIAQSALSLSDWFGILLINVLGSWTGSFGIDTIAGTIAGPPSTDTATSGNTTNNTVDQPTTLFRFISRSATTAFRSSTSTPSTEPTDSSLTNLSDGSVLAAAQNSVPGGKSSGSGKNQTSLFWLYAVFIGIWIVLLAAERIYAKLRNRTT